jgi:hypothetical protein
MTFRQILIPAIAGLAAAGLAAGVAIAGNRPRARQSAVVIIRDLERDGHPVVVADRLLRG